MRLRQALLTEGQVLRELLLGCRQPLTINLQSGLTESLLHRHLVALEADGRFVPRLLDVQRAPLQLRLLHQLLRAEIHFGRIPRFLQRQAPSLQGGILRQSGGLHIQLTGGQPQLLESSGPLFFHRPHEPLFVRRQRLHELRVLLGQLVRSELIIGRDPCLVQRQTTAFQRGLLGQLLGTEVHFRDIPRLLERE